MSGTDGIRSDAEAAHRSLEDAAERVGRAVAEAAELELSAAAHGWTGVAQAMSSEQEALAAAAGSLGEAQAAVTAGISALTPVGEEPSSDEVAARLAGVVARLDAALDAAGRAAEGLGTALELAAESDAESLAWLVDDAADSLGTAREALETAATAAAAEQSAAGAWGTTGVGGDTRPSPSTTAPAHIAQPGNVRGPLGEHFRPGVHDPEGHFTEKERAIADWLSAREPGASIHPRIRDPAKHEKSPDAMIRSNPDDLGVITEFKTMDRPTIGAVKDNLKLGTRQVVAHGNGHVVVDGRTVGVTQTDARLGMPASSVSDDTMAGPYLGGSRSFWATDRH